MNKVLTMRLRGWLIISLATLLLGLSGCTMVRLGYGNADDLAYLWLDGWLDFNDEQTPQARKLLADTLQWHRRTQLPDYARWLAKIQADVMQDTTPEAVCKLGNELNDRISTLSERVMPASADIAVTLTDAQLAHMQKRFDQGQKKFLDEYGKGDAKAREAATLERSISRAESIYGSLDDAQRAVLAQAAKSSPFDAQLTATERATRMREMMQILKTARDAAAAGPEAKAQAAAQLQVVVKKWLREGRASPRAVYRAYQERSSDYTCTVSAQVHNAAAPATRQGARDRLKGWEADARALHAPVAAQ